MVKKIIFRISSSFNKRKLLLILNMQFKYFQSPIKIKIFQIFLKKSKKIIKIILVNKLIETFDILDSKVNLIFSSSKNPFN